MNEIKSHYNYPEILHYITKKGAELYGPNFQILENDYPVIYRLIAYFLQDEPTAFQFGIDLNKGIFLSGPVGCGKTTLMTIMKSITKAENKFIMKPCREVSFEFITDGYEVIHRYSKNMKLGAGSAGSLKYCFDDLGIESNLKFYGNECNVMAEVLLSRYDLFIAKKLQTHITTNLSANEVETHYGIRVRSRLRQMVNLIAFETTTKDKR